MTFLRCPVFSRQSMDFEGIGKPNPDGSCCLVGNSRTCCSLLLAKVRIPNVKGVHTTQLDSQSDVFSLFFGWMIVRL